jgi:hypothetical protein
MSSDIAKSIPFMPARSRATGVAMHPSRSLIALIALVAVVACRGKKAGSDSAAATATAPAACVEGGGTPTLTAAGVGPVRVGARLASITDRCTVRDTTFSLGEGRQEHGRVVSFGGSSATLMVSDDSAQTIERIIVADSAIRTEAGIGVGKTVGAMRAAYGRLCAASGEGRIIVGVPPLPGVSFGTSAALRAGVNVESTPEAIPDSTTITGIWVYGGRAACGGS